VNLPLDRLLNEVRGATSAIGAQLPPQVGPLWESVVKRAALEASRNETINRLSRILTATLPYLKSPAQRPGEPPAPDVSALQDVPSELTAGISMNQLISMYKGFAAIKHSRKNLWYIEIEDGSPPPGFGGLAALRLNMFAQDVDYAPYTMSGDVVRIGSANMDALQGTERVQMRVTTLDDDVGRIKRWAQAKAAQMTRANGLFGVPASYVFTVKVAHMDVLGDRGIGYVERVAMRIENVELSLSRREQAAEEVVLSFVEFDTFMGSGAQ
jgi:hypothetical protein